MGATSPVQREELNEQHGENLLQTGDETTHDRSCLDESIIVLIMESLPLSSIELFIRTLHYQTQSALDLNDATHRHDCSCCELMHL